MDSSTRKPHYRWNQEFEFWYAGSGNTGYKPIGGRWFYCWLEPDIDDPLCWFPNLAGQLIVDPLPANVTISPGSDRVH